MPDPWNRSALICICSGELTFSFCPVRESVLTMKTVVLIFFASVTAVQAVSLYDFMQEEWEYFKVCYHYS
jgi:hypothetical protein